MSETANLLHSMVIAEAESLHADDLQARGVRPGFDAVSYTHLTLPTNREV